MSSKSKINLKDKVDDGEIDLSVCEIKDVPVKEIAVYKKVFSLDLSNNLIVTLPKQFASLVHLTKLDLSKNQLRELPENFGDLVKLKHLDLYKNALQHLPLSFGRLVALRWLDLKDNPLVPAIRETAGPCGDSKECQLCAKNTVSFYGKMAAGVAEEKMARERQREEDRKQKELALKNQKHKDKKKKNKETKLQKQQNGVHHDTAATKTTSEPDIIHNATKNGGKATKKSTNAQQRKRSKTKSISCCGLLCNILLGLLMTSVTLFVLTSIKLAATQPIESGVVHLYKAAAAGVPVAYRAYERQFAHTVALAHNVTGDSLMRLWLEVERLQVYDYVAEQVQQLKRYVLSN